MKKFAYAAILTLAAGMMYVPTRAADDGDKKFTVHGEIRTRLEHSDNLSDLTDTDGGSFKDSLTFGAYRARVGVMGQFSRGVAGYVELQNFGTWGNDWPTKGFEDALFQNDNQIDDSEVALYQAYIALNNINDTNWSVKIGRQEISFANELMMGDNDYYNGQSFDGVIAGVENEKWGLHFGALTVMDNNFSGNILDCGGGSSCTDDNIDLYGGGAHFQIGDTRQMIEPYIIYYRDGDFLGVQVYTIGARYSRDANHGSNALLDWSIELAGQSGSLSPNGADLSMGGAVAEGDLGFNFWHGDDGHSRVYVGLFMTTGDDDPGDDNIDNFFPLFGDIHNRLGHIDRGGIHSISGVASLLTGDFVPGDTGITDAHIGYDGHFGNHTFMVGFHNLVATEDANLPNNEDSIGQVIDLGYDYMYSSNLGFGVEVSDFSPGDLFKNAGFEDDAIRVAGQARLRW